MNHFLRYILSVCFFLFAIQIPLLAQMEKTMYQLFEIDSVKHIELDLAGEYEILVWAGNSILVETQIQISNASPEILEFLIKEGRYDLKADTLSEQEWKIQTKVRDRKPIKTPMGECTELAVARLFVPDAFIVSEDRKKLTRKQ